MESITIKAGKREIEGTVNVPLSKSISNRILMMSAISEGKVKYDELSDADDTILLQGLLEQIKKGKDHYVNTENAGTAMRFLTAYLAITPGEWILDGDDRMRQRPIGGLVDGLKDLGSDITYTGKEGYPPLKINGKKINKRNVNIDPGTSSQFISALMMIGPMLPDGISIFMTGPPSSLPYIEMTASLMEQAGADIEVSLPMIKISGKGYTECTLSCESDWSAAAPWYQLFSLSRGSKLSIKGLKEDSLQGDSRLAFYFRMLGVETEYKKDGVELSKMYQLSPVINFDLHDYPDLAPSLIVTTAAKMFEGNFYGLQSLRIKETDRLEALASELKKAGIDCHASADEFSFKEQKLTISQPVDTYNDHRIAMAFAPLAILGKPVTINDPSVVSKSYPGFWEELKKIIDFG